jgi:hypothetical protein
VAAQAQDAARSDRDRQLARKAHAAVIAAARPGF